MIKISQYDRYNLFQPVTEKFKNADWSPAGTTVVMFYQIQKVSQNTAVGYPSWESLKDTSYCALCRFHFKTQ